MNKLLKATIQERGQVTIPLEAREALHLKAGEEVVFYVHDNELILKVLYANPLEKAGMLGKIKGTKRVKDLTLEYGSW